MHDVGFKLLKIVAIRCNLRCNCHKRFCGSATWGHTVTKRIHNVSGGSGPIDKQCAESLLANEREIVLHEHCGDIEIFKNLSMNRVAYFPTRKAVYFVASVHSNIPDIIHSVFKGLKKTATIDRLFLDQHKFFDGPLRLRVDEAEARALLVALRLNQISVSTAKAQLSG